MKKIYIQPLATIHHVNIESIMIEASDQGDHAESKPNPFEEDQAGDWDEWEGRRASPSPSERRGCERIRGDMSGSLSPESASSSSFGRRGCTEKWWDC